MMNSESHVFVFGGNRFVGKKLVERLVSDGITVTCFNRSGTAPDGAMVIQGDRNNLEDLQKIDYTYVTHIVDMCLFNGSQYELVRPLLPQNVHYIFMSSAAVYPHYTIQSTEGMYVLNGNHVFGYYGANKIICEMMIQQDSLIRHFTILRPPYIIGKGNHRDRIQYFINDLQKNGCVHHPSYRMIDNLISYVSANDVVKTILFVMSDFKSRDQIYNVSAGSTSIGNFAETISKVFNKKGRFSFGDVTLNDYPFSDTNLSIDSKKLHQRMKYDFQSLDEIVQEFYNE